jgi:hypothetical protein
MGYRFTIPEIVQVRFEDLWRKGVGLAPDKKTLINSRFGFPGNKEKFYPITGREKEDFSN